MKSLGNALSIGFTINGQSLIRIAQTPLTLGGYACSEHGKVNPRDLLKKGRTYLVCQYCVAENLNISEPKPDERRKATGELGL